LTAPVTTKTAVSSDTAVGIIVIILTQALTGRVSVGLNALALVNDRNR